MGWYINYEVEFDKFIEDWDNKAVKVCLLPFNVDHLYLRDLAFTVSCCRSTHKTPKKKFLQL